MAPTFSVPKSFNYVLLFILSLNLIGSSFANLRADVQSTQGTTAPKKPCLPTIKPSKKGPSAKPTSKPSTKGPSAKPSVGPYSPKKFKTAANNQSIVYPAKNTLFLCPQTILNFTIPPKFYRLYRQNSSWVKGDYIIVDEIEKIKVPGSVSMKSKFKVTKTKTYRHLEGNGIPNHPIGTYPIQPGSKAYDIYSQLTVQGYPNAAAIPVYPYNLSVYLPLNPKVNAKPTCLASAESIVIGVSTQTGGTWHLEVALAGYHYYSSIIIYIDCN